MNNNNNNNNDNNNNNYLKIIIQQGLLSDALNYVKIPHIKIKHTHLLKK